MNNPKCYQVSTSANLIRARSLKWFNPKMKAQKKNLFSKAKIEEH